MSNWSYVGPLWQVPKDSVGSGRDFECPGKIVMRSRFVAVGLANPKRITIADDV